MSTVTVFLLGGRLLLAAVFGVAGAAKLVDLPGSRRALRAFGVPNRLAGPLGVALPIAELAIAAALLDERTAWLAAVAALGLLTLFIGTIASHLMGGRTPDCHCFGQLHSRPVSVSTLARNGGLGAVAAAVVVGGWTGAGPSVYGWLTPLTTAEQALAIGGLAALAMIFAQGVLLLRLTRQHTVLLSRFDSWSAHALAADAARAAANVPPDASQAPAGLPVGSVAPNFTLTSLEGDIVTLGALTDRTGKDLILVFSDPACGPCTRLLPDIGQWQREHANLFGLALVSRGAPEANRAKTDEHGVTRVLLQRDNEVADAFKVLGTPSAVLIRPNGTIGTPLAQGEIEIAHFIGELTHTSPPGPAPGDVAPGFALPDLDGQQVTLDQFRGQPVVVLFWSPGCGHCQHMLGDLRAWEASPPANAPRLVVVSNGSADANRSQGLHSPLVLDGSFAVGRQYASRGTPSAVLIDASGHVASTLGTGAQAVMALLAPRQGAAEAGATAVSPVADPLAGPAPALAPGDKPSRKSCVQDELLADGGIVLYDSCRRQVMTLNATAALVWDYCDGDTPVEAIVAGVRDVFPSEAAAEGDVRELLSRLLREQMVELLSEADGGGHAARALQSSPTP